MNATIPRPEDPSDDVVTLAVEVLRILADSTRLRIATLLIDAELSVSDLAVAVKRPVPGVSQHLAKMRLAHLVTRASRGRRCSIGSTTSTFGNSCSTPLATSSTC